MIFDTLEQKLERIRKQHDEKLAKLKLNNELKITENKLKNQLSLQELEAENGQLNVKRDIFNLNNATKKDDSTIKSGSKLKIFALLTTFVTTCLTIAGGYTDFSNSIFTLIPYIIAIVILQFTVYLISAQETRIKQEFNRHYSKVITLKYSLLGISIYSNYRFFAKEANTIISHIIIFTLCVALDLIAIFLVSLAFDQRTLTFSYQEDKPKAYNNLLYKLGCNITHNIVYRIESNYAKNQNRIMSLDKKSIIVEVVADEVKQIEKVKPELLIADPQATSYKILNFDKRFKNKKFIKRIENTKKITKKLHPDLAEKYSKIKSYLLENLQVNDVVSSIKIKTKFKLTITEYRKILEELKLENIVKTEGKKTYMAKQLLTVVK
jgi:hypothetical protein